MSVESQIWRASAPGSLMLMGEHAVLHGRRSLVCAVNQRIQITLEPRSDSVVRIISQLGEDQAHLDEIDVRPPFTFIWESLRQARQGLPGGCDLHVESDFSDQIGLGSSAAVTVALAVLLRVWQGEDWDPALIQKQATAVIRAVQGRGSGADAAASVLGGIVEYRAQPYKMESMHAVYPISVIYSGYKTPTAEVIAHVERERRARAALFEGFFYEIDECVRTAIDAICRDDWNELGLCMDHNQALLQALGVSDETLEKIIAKMRRDTGILGAKISGSGLGDCVLGLGTLQGESEPYRPINCEMTQEGVRIEKV